MRKFLLFTFLGLIFCDISNAAELPLCSDTKLEDGVRKTLEKYITEKESSAPSEARKAKLLAKYSQNFETVDTASFKPDEERSVANLIIDLKMNYALGDNDIRVCKDPYKINKKTIYIVVYRKDNKVFVEIPNAYDSIGTTEKVIFEY